jgi:hypothetical protein
MFVLDIGFKRYRIGSRDKATKILRSLERSSKDYKFWDFEKRMLIEHSRKMISKKKF